MAKLSDTASEAKQFPEDYLVAELKAVVGQLPRDKKLAALNQAALQLVREFKKDFKPWKIRFEIKKAVRDLFLIQALGMPLNGQPEFSGDISTMWEVNFAREMRWLSRANDLLILWQRYGISLKGRGFKTLQACIQSLSISSKYPD